MDDILDTMISQWYELKPKAIELRKQGFSIRDIEIKLGIPRSTLSGWLKNIKLTKKQRERLKQNWLNALAKARKKAVLWHNAQKTKRIENAQKSARQTLDNLDLTNKAVVELALAMLYMGEGSKKSQETALSNSDPLILKLFLATLKNIYAVQTRNIRCELHLRADQDPETMKHFWAKELNLPLENFRYISIDKRTIGKKTYPHYKGVCAVKCGPVAIQRKLLHLSKLFCEYVSKNYSGV